MAQTRFSGPVKSDNGFIGTQLVAAGAPLAQITPVATAALPPAAPANAGTVMLINDNGAGNNEWALVISTGVAWVLCDGTALS